MRVAAFLPAKSTSERLFNKNVALLDGKPLLLHNLEKLCACSVVDEVWLDTDSEAIFEMARHLPVRWLKRDPRLATNATDGHELFMNEVRSIEADAYVQILATSPFLKPSTIEAAIAAVGDGTHDSALAVFKERQYLWRDGMPEYGRGRIPNSVDLPPAIREAMSLYVVRRDAALACERRFGDRPKLIEIDPMEAVDVNTPEDFVLANRIAAGVREHERTRLRVLRALLTSATVSDTLDDHGLSSTIIGLQANFEHAKILGRANTLDLRPLEQGEDFRGIYDALDSYDSVIPNDVLCVANATPQYAYFGEMNAHLAIRRGAVGMITNGATRDVAAVVAFQFPTFAGGRSARDVRGRATLKSIGKPIEISGVPIRPGDLVMGDADGVCIIPKEHEEKILTAMLDRLRVEAHIALDIGADTSEKELVRRHGEF